MKTKKMIKLIDEMAELIQFHELEAVDSKAADLLLQAEKMKQTSVSELEPYLEQIRLDNIHSMVG